MMNAVVAHLWQSTLFAGLAALLTLLFRRNRANTRYCIWLAASVKFLIPVAPLVAVVHDLTWQAASIGMAPGSLMLPQPAAPAMPMAAMAPLAVAPAGHAGSNVAVILLAVWACGTTAAAVWWLIRWLRMRAVVRASSPLPLDAPIQVRCSPSLVEPGLCGIFMPVIVLPAGTVAALSPEQLDAILVHELSHWRRRDNLTAALHMLVEALFWFHPLIWWIGRRLIVEREQACDEAVIESRCGREAYAGAILNICRGSLRQPLPCVSGVAGGDLKRRIATIMTAPVGEKLRIGRKLLLTSVTCAAIAAPVAVGMIGAWRAAAAELQDGLGAFDHGDYRSALAQLQPLADQGNATAEDYVGQMYDQGLGVQQDYARAVAWYRRAALQGDSGGQAALSGMYASGQGIAHDPLASALWGRQGLLHVIENPCDPRFIFEFQGFRSSLRDEQAAQQAAAERGDAQAAVDLGSLYESYGPGKPDHRNASKWISRAAAQGNAKGEAALASLYLKGSAVAPDSAAAVTWMRKAADQGHARAQCALAVMYDKGLGVAPDPAEAARWYRRVADDKVDRVTQDWARTRLAALYAAGDGVPRDEGKALALLRGAAERGYPFAETRLGIRYAEGNGLVQQDYAAAARLLGSAAKKGVPAAQIALGNLYADGLGVPRNPTAAYKWFDLAARYSTSPMERDAASKDRAAISGRMTHGDIALAERLVERWLPADEIGEGAHAGGDI